MKKREPELDFLRFLALLCVMGLHVCSSVWQQLPLFLPPWLTATVLRQTWAVPVLVMITGRLLLDPEREPGLRKRITRIARVYPVWSVLYQLYYLALRWPNLDWKGFLYGCVTGAYHMWYLWMLLGLYAAVPLLRPIAREKRLCEYFLLLHLLAGVLTYFVPALPFVGNTGKALADMLQAGCFLGYGGLFLLGCYLHRWPPREGLVYAAGMVSAVVSFLGNLALARKTGANSEFFTSYLAPTMLPVAGAVFTLFTRRVRVKLPRRLAELSLGAYLCHALVNEGVVWLMGKKILMAQPLWMLPATALVAAGSYGLAYVFKKLPVLSKFLG